VTAFYLSNVEQYLFNDFRADDFYNNSDVPLDSAARSSVPLGRRRLGATSEAAHSGLQTLSPMKELEEFKAGRVRQYGDVRSLSQ
jgi:hypothetical protein